VAFVESWLAQADDSVTADFESFAASYTLVELRGELIALAASLGSATMERR